MERIEQIISVYRAAYKRALVRGEMSKAEFYGQRVTMWIQRAESKGFLDDGNTTAFAICKGAR